MLQIANLACYALMITATRPAKLNITICGVFELPEQQGKGWTHVISIWDKAFATNPVCREMIQATAPQAKHQYCFFLDTDDANDPEAPSLSEVERILTFTKDLSQSAKILVHCRAGISRSTATSYAILCQHTPAGQEWENLNHVKSLRDFVMPNRLVVRYADKILKRGGAMLDKLDDY